MGQHTERELTYAVDTAWELPDLDGAVPEGGSVERAEHELRASYLDTATASLRALGITFRRRTGGHDAGWHLKVPAGDARLERQSRSTEETPPAALLELVQGLLGDQELTEVAVITTRRRTTEIHDAEGGLVLEIADDQVEGLAAGAATPSRWREVEVELGDSGTEDDLATVGRLLVEAGAEERGNASKLAHTLGELEAPPDDALSTYLRDECRDALLGELALREQADVDGVHDTRVAIRRVRGTLRVFAALLEPAAVAVDDDLRWVAALLGDVRDADVLRHHLHAEVDALPPELVMGPVHDELDEQIGTDREAALRRWRLERDSDRYRSAMAALAAWYRHPPLRDGVTAEDVTKAASTTLAEAKRTAKKRLKKAGHDPERLHRARKAVKRLRYAAELLAPVLPDAGKIAAKAEHAQTVLGDHQDLAVRAAFLRRQGAVVGARAGHNGFTYGLLLARAEHEAAAIRASPPRL